jgi:hypothetical protein
VPPGRYQLAAQLMPAPGERSAPLVIARVPIEVWDRDLDGVVALLQPGVTVSGRIHVDGAPPASGQQPLIQLIGMNGLPGSSAMRLDAEGAFTINNVAIGDYRWRLLPVGGGLRTPPWAKTARFGTDDVSKRFMSVGAEAASRKFEIEISTRTATLEAILLDDRRRPMAGVLVIAVPDPTRRMHSDAYRSGVTDAEGRVKFEGMVPADYQVFATETVPAEAWQDPAVLKRHDGKGLPINLAEGAVRVVELRISS